MINDTSKQTDDEFVNFLIKCSDFDNLEFVNFKTLPKNSELFIIRSVLTKNGYKDYTLIKYKLLKFNEEEKYIELEDSMKKYAGCYQFDKFGNLIFSISSKGETDIFEKAFDNYLSAIKYMSHLKYICDISEDAFLLKILQQINKIDRGNNGKR